MSFFDRLDAYKPPEPKKPDEPPKAIPMPRLSFDEIEAMQSEGKRTTEAIKRKPGRPPKTIK